MTASTFLDDRNVVVFEHLVIGSDLAQAITRHIANVLDTGLCQIVMSKLAELAAMGGTAMPAGSDDARLFRHSINSDSKLGPPTEPPVQRESDACLALIRDPAAPDRERWLMQWNARWRVMHLLGGHREPDDPNDLTCMIRELHEELFGPLSPEDLEAMRVALGSSHDYAGPVAGWSDPYLASVRRSTDPPHEFPEYVAWSDGFAQWTRYHLRLYEVQLTEQGYQALFIADAFAAAGPGAKPEAPCEWVTREDITRRWTQLGRPISPTTQRILGVR